jgi:hypothetical protein
MPFRGFSGAHSEPVDTVTALSCVLHVQPTASGPCPCCRPQAAPWAQGPGRAVLPLFGEGDAQQGAEGSPVGVPEGNHV